MPLNKSIKKRSINKYLIFIFNEYYFKTTEN